MIKERKVLNEDFNEVTNIYDQVMADNVHIHDLIYPHVFGENQYIGQFSDNSKDELLKMAEAMQLPPKSRVLDLGCGRGKIATFFARTFDWHITGIDLSRVPINAATLTLKDSPELSLDFVKGDIYHHTFSHLFSGIYGTGAFCHFNAKNLFQHCHTLLEKQGRFAFMERVRLGTIDENAWNQLTKEWCCPYVYSEEEYHALLKETGFRVIHSNDLTKQFRIWQERSVSVRESLKDQIIEASNETYYQSSLDFAKYENNVTRLGFLGYVCIIAEKV